MTVKTPVFIKNLMPIAFGYEVQQDECLLWLKAAHAKANEHTTLEDVDTGRSYTVSALYDRIGKSTAIDRRTTCLPDYTHQAWGDMTLFRGCEPGSGGNAPWHTPHLERRMEIYGRVCEDIAHLAYADKSLLPSYLIKVSCTGYVSPNELQTIVEKNQWDRSTRLLQLGHMGCYAAIPALNLAAQLASTAEQSTVSILSTELCSLHLQPTAVDMKQAVINSLFSDGAVRIDVSDQCEGSGYEILGHFECVIPGSAGEMSWIVGDSSFRMTLSNGVPTILAKHLPTMIDDFLATHALQCEDLGLVAIHPGGPRIIDGVAQCLSLDEEKIRHSRAVLRNRGNMSSATIPYIWHAMLEDDDVPTGTVILSCAFGPGLTLAANLIRKVRRDGC